MQQGSISPPKYCQIIVRYKLRNWQKEIRIWLHQQNCLEGKTDDAFQEKSTQEKCTHLDLICITLDFLWGMAQILDTTKKCVRQNLDIGQGTKNISGTTSAFLTQWVGISVTLISTRKEGGPSIRLMASSLSSLSREEQVGWI